MGIIRRTFILNNTFSPKCYSKTARDPKSREKPPKVNNIRKCTESSKGQDTETSLEAKKEKLESVSIQFSRELRRKKLI